MRVFIPQRACIAITFIIWTHLSVTSLSTPFCNFIIICLPPSVCTCRDAPKSQSSSNKPMHSDYSNITVIFGLWQWHEHAKWNLDWARHSSNGICCDSGKGHWPKCPWSPSHHISIVFPCPYFSCHLPVPCWCLGFVCPWNSPMSTQRK